MEPYVNHYTDHLNFCGSRYVGANGDVFIGSATNIIYGLARDINFRRQGTDGKAAWR